MQGMMVLKATIIKKKKDIVKYHRKEGQGSIREVKVNCGINLCFHYFFLCVIDAKRYMPKKCEEVISYVLLVDGKIR